VEGITSFNWSKSVGVSENTPGLFIRIGLKQNSGNVNANLMNKFWNFQSSQQRFITNSSPFIGLTLFPSLIQQT
jgi:hypothetical protein